MRMFAKQRRMHKFVCIAIIVFVVFLFLGSRAIIIMQDISANRVKYITTLEINAAISGYLSQCEEAYGDILIKDKTADGRIRAINTDVVKINRMQAEITREIQTRLDETGAYEITFPIMNMFGMKTLTAFGPKIGMELSPATNITARFEDKFEAAGINQTRFSVNLIVDADVVVAVAPVRNKVHVSHSVPVVQLILIGDVPQTYADIQK